MTYADCLFVRTDRQLAATLVEFPQAVGFASAVVEPQPVTLPPTTQAIVLTSANAVPAVANSPFPVCAVGEHTAAAAAAAGLEIAHIGTENGEELAKSMVSAYLHFKEICHVHGVNYRNNWYKICESAGITVTETVGYRLKPASHLPADVAAHLKSGRIRYVILFSVQAAESLISCASLANIDLQSLTAVVLSARIAAATKAFGETLVAPAPTRAGISEIIKR